MSETLHGLRKFDSEVIHIFGPGDDTVLCGTHDVEDTSSEEYRVYRLNVSVPSAGRICGRCDDATNQWWYGNSVDVRKELRKQYKELEDAIGTTDSGY